jgi:hypothetical protein
MIFFGDVGCKVKSKKQLVIYNGITRVVMSILRNEVFKKVSRRN